MVKRGLASAASATAFAGQLMLFKRVALKVADPDRVIKRRRDMELVMEGIGVWM